MLRPHKLWSSLGESKTKASDADTLRKPLDAGPLLAFSWERTCRGAVPSSSHHSAHSSLCLHAPRDRQRGDLGGGKRLRPKGIWVFSIFEEAQRSGRETRGGSSR